MGNSASTFDEADDSGEKKVEEDTNNGGEATPKIGKGIEGQMDFPFKEDWPGSALVTDFTNLLIGAASNIVNEDHSEKAHPEEPKQSRPPPGVNPPKLPSSRQALPMHAGYCGASPFPGEGELDVLTCDWKTYIIVDDRLLNLMQKYTTIDGPTIRFINDLKRLDDRYEALMTFIRTDTKVNLRGMLKAMVDADMYRQVRAVEKKDLRLFLGYPLRGNLFEIISKEIQEDED